MIDTRHLALPKPGAKPARNAPIKVYPDGREVCNQRTRGGRREYKSRRDQMWERQRGFCGYCGVYVPKSEATFEHVDGRGKGKRDDRIVDEQGKPINLMACWNCNTTKGSQRQWTPKV